MCSGPVSELHFEFHVEKAEVKYYGFVILPAFGRCTFVAHIILIMQAPTQINNKILRSKLYPTISNSCYCVLFFHISALCFLLLSTFWLPLTSVKKRTLEAILVIVPMIFLLFFSRKISAFNHELPKISKYTLSNESSYLQTIKYSIVQDHWNRKLRVIGIK